MKIIELLGDALSREWGYWTRNKLAILAGYLPAFNLASTKSRERIYIDLMSGEPENIARDTKERFDGSARLAMGARPGFTRLAFIEREPARAAALREDLDAKFPGDVRGRVYEGDCNEVVDRVLADVSEWRWAPTFVFIDQQAAEATWDTMTKIAQFRSGKWKAEQWILMSPALIAKGARGTNAAEFSARVTALYGTCDWMRVMAGRDAGLLDAEGFRREMVNLFRWRLESDLGYAVTARIPMYMGNNLPLYDMVFATDHAVGLKIMKDVYRRAAEREPELRREYRASRLNTRSGAASQESLFDVTPGLLDDIDVPAWTHESCWDPVSTAWWSDSTI